MSKSKHRKHRNWLAQNHRSGEDEGVTKAAGAKKKAGYQAKENQAKKKRNAAKGQR